MAMISEIIKFFRTGKATDSILPLPMPPTQIRRRRFQWARLFSEKGFTMIELVLVISVMGVLSIVAIASMGDGMAPISVDAAARKIKADLRYTQNLATSTSQTHGFRVTGNTTYEVYNAATGDIVNSAYNTPLQVDLSTDFNNATFSNVATVIEFDFMGTPTTGGGETIQIVDSNDPSIIKEVQITANSGYISIP